MISNLQKKEFIKTIYERISEDKNSGEMLKELMQLLMEDTGTGKMYKYRTINDNALSNLKDGTLYCAVPSSFNDPFDCRIGIDVNSYITSIYQRELEGIDNYLLKFVKVLDNKVSLEDCTDREKIVLQKWFKSIHLRKLIEDYLESDMTDEKLIEMMASNYDIVDELFSGYSSNEAFLEFLKRIKDAVPLISNIEKKQWENMISGNTSLVDFVKSVGIDDDVDEIKMVALLHQVQNPEQAELAQKFDEDLAKIDYELSESIDRQYRVGSICTDYKNRLMWSHYADGHKGFCIEFDFNQGCEVVKDLLILPVVYSKERIKFPWNVAFANYKDDKKIQMEAAQTQILSLLTKDEVWSYENEWRVITTNSLGIENVKMPPISCIYIGALCSDKNKETLIRLAKEMNVPVKQMVVDRGEYTLHAEECI